MSEFLTSLGYLGAFFGTMLEGEIALISALQTAQLGYTNFYGILAAGFLGTLVTDWFFFLSARRGGKKMVENKPKLRSKLNRINGMLDRYGNWLLLFYRFFYGFRIALPMLFGLSNIPTKKFAFFNLLSTMLWLSMLAFLGQYIAQWLGIGIDASV